MALGEFEKLGARLQDIELENVHLSVPAYYVVAPAEASSNLSRFDGVRFGHRAEGADKLGINEFYKRNRGEGFGAEVKRRILTGTYVLSAGYFDAYYLQAQKVRRLISDDFARAFKEVDFVAGPTTPTPAFKIGQKTDDPIEMYLNDIYTIGANLAGLPAISLPCGFVDRLPVGLQLIGPALSEARLLKTAHYFQQATNWHAQFAPAYA
jgi:aspartyl-tRNA(Asn)/glutamyl-tRNA(Gln) amidotransferase subunit A